MLSSGVFLALPAARGISGCPRVVSCVVDVPVLMCAYCLTPQDASFSILYVMMKLLWLTTISEMMKKRSCVYTKGRWCWTDVPTADVIRTSSFTISTDPPTTIYTWGDVLIWIDVLLTDVLAVLLTLPWKAWLRSRWVMPLCSYLDCTVTCLQEVPSRIECTGLARISWTGAGFCSLLC